MQCVEPPPQSIPATAAHNAAIQAVLSLLKGLLRGESFAVLPGKFHRKTLAMRRSTRADIWGFYFQTTPVRSGTAIALRLHPTTQFPSLL